MRLNAFWKTKTYMLIDIRRVTCNRFTESEHCFWAGYFNANSLHCYESLEPPPQVFSQKTDLQRTECEWVVSVPTWPPQALFQKPVHWQNILAKSWMFHILQRCIWDFVNKLTFYSIVNTHTCLSILQYLYIWYTDTNLLSVKNASVEMVHFCITSK